MAGLVLAVACFGVIALLMVLGVKAKYPPPDPDWREHLPPPPPEPSRAWQIFRWGPLVGYCALLVVMGILISTGQTGQSVARILGSIAIVLLLLRVGANVAWGVHVGRERRRQGWRPYRG
jgi:hypothetical protein